MLKTKFLIGLLVTITMLVAQFGAVFAAPVLQEPSPIKGIVQSITLETDINTGITTVLVTVSGEDDLSPTVRVTQETAISLGLVTRNADGNPLINTMALGELIEVEPTTVIPNKEVDKHPIGSALATFFSGITGLTYDQIMTVHNKGTGFGMIAQALWLTMKFEGDSEIFLAILDAKQTGDYSAFILDGGTTPKNWEQLRKAILDRGKNGNLGIVMSNQDKNKDKNSNTNENGNSGQNNSGNGNGNNQEKDRDKDNNGGGNNRNDQNKDEGQNKDKKK
jgi:hypothetical protein